jgi:Derlin-2/3
MLYLWCRRNPNTEINIMEFITFRAQFLPWLLITLVVVFGFDVQDDLVGAAVGHMYYFLMDVVPKIPETNKLSVLSAPSILNRLCQWLRIHEAGGNWESDFIG